MKTDGVARRNGPTEWPDGVARRSFPTGWPDGVAGAERSADGRPSGADGCLTGGAQAPDGGCPTEGGSRGVADGGLGGGPTGDYIRVPGPHFWALSSSAQSHLQEMRVRRVLMSESAEIPKGILFEVKLEILGLD
jgi:hypothetical protein